MNENSKSIHNIFAMHHLPNKGGGGGVQTKMNNFACEFKKLKNGPYSQIEFPDSREKGNRKKKSLASKTQSQTSSRLVIMNCLSF
jgi:hypothetical protein